MRLLELETSLCIKMGLDLVFYFWLVESLRSIANADFNLNKLLLYNIRNFIANYKQ